MFRTSEKSFWDFLSCQGTTLQKLDFSKSFQDEIIQWDLPMREFLIHPPNVIFFKWEDLTQETQKERF